MYCYRAVPLLFLDFCSNYFASASSLLTVYVKSLTFPSIFVISKLPLTDDLREWVLGLVPLEVLLPFQATIFWVAKVAVLLFFLLQIIFALINMNYVCSLNIISMLEPIKTDIDYRKLNIAAVDKTIKSFLI